MVAGTTGGARVRFNIQAGRGLNPAEAIAPSTFSFSPHVTEFEFAGRSETAEKYRYHDNDDADLCLITVL